MAETMRKPREKRWIVLGEDGRHVTLGRHTDPTEAEIAAAQAALAAQGLAGWLAVMEGDHFGRRSPPALLMARPLGLPRVPFEQAAGAFEAARRRAFSRHDSRHMTHERPRRRVAGTAGGAR